MIADIPNAHALSVLLMQGLSADINRLKLSGELLVLDSTMDLPHTQKAPLALLIMVGVVTLAALNVLRIVSIAMELGLPLEPFVLAVRQPELRDADGLQDQHPGHERRRLQVWRLRARGHAAHDPDVGLVARPLQHRVRVVTSSR